ncbi:unnamed protein product [Leuciscus chuanchicus]
MHTHSRLCSVECHLCARFGWHTLKSASGRSRWHTVTVQLSRSGAKRESSPSIHPSSHASPGKQMDTFALGPVVRVTIQRIKLSVSVKPGKLSEFILGWITFGASDVRCASPPLIR